MRVIDKTHDFYILNSNVITYEDLIKFKIIKYILSSLSLLN